MMAYMAIVKREIPQLLGKSRHFGDELSDREIAKIPGPVLTALVSQGMIELGPQASDPQFASVVARMDKQGDETKALRARVLKLEKKYGASD